MRNLLGPTLFLAQCLERTLLIQLTLYVCGLLACLASVGYLPSFGPLRSFLHSIYEQLVNPLELPLLLFPWGI